MQAPIATTTAGTGFQANSTSAKPMIDSVIAISFTGSPRTSRAAPWCLSFSVSITQGGTVAARIGAALKEPLFLVDADRVCVTHVVVPVGDHLHRLSAALEFTHHLIGDASFERQVARARAPGPAHEPRRNQGVERPFARLQMVGMLFVKREECAAILQDDAGVATDHRTAEVM